MARERPGHTLQTTALVNEAVVGMMGADILALDEALTELAEFDERKSKIIEGQYFAGLTTPQLADLTGVSERTVERDAQLARAWLAKRLT